MEFHVSKKSRDTYGFDKSLFTLKGTVVFANLPAAREFTKKLQVKYPALRYQDIFAMGLIDEILHHVIGLYGESLGGTRDEFSARAWAHCLEDVGEARLKSCVRKFATAFPPIQVYKGEVSLDAYLDALHDGQPGYVLELEEMLMLWVENQNPAYQMLEELFSDQQLGKNSAYQDVINSLYSFCAKLPAFGPDEQNIVDMIRSPALHHPHSLELQLEYIRIRWGNILGDFLSRLLRGIDYLKEVNAFFLRQGMGAEFGPDLTIPEYGRSGMEEYERFSPDRDWMPRVVLLARSTLVWLHQLSMKYGTSITRLDQIPDEELDLISSRGFNALWLIGLWERSDASRKIKNRCGNPDAAASAYSLMGYDIADEIGGWPALEELRRRAWKRGIRLASDMVPNHTGMESHWVFEHPEYFVQLDHPPFPGYTFGSENLSSRPETSLFLEDHYYDRSDASVVFKRIDNRTGEARYIYHGNDGTHMPWNDTAQLDFSRKEVREAVIQTILHVSRNFPIIRFDAAMTLVKKHIQRLWFPEPGRGGDIPSRSEHGMTAREFEEAIPQEFWREVVDRCAVETPDTLLLAEAFWMMEGYFVRTLGMHRVYNSAFMNMLKMEENGKYRQTIKNTLIFDRDILKRFVNFMSNPDEETAEAQFGKGDKYFGVCTLMVTMPGLPMFGHGQIEGFTEKYGMEFRKAYREEQPDRHLIDRHYHEIFPLMKKRHVFADATDFRLFDVLHPDGQVDENVFAYTNRCGQDRALVVYNNAFPQVVGTMRESCEFLVKAGNGDRTTTRTTLAEALGLDRSEDGFCLMHEQRSGLWYIRRNQDLHAGGMTVILNGYQSQVYLDIHEVHDNMYRHYRQLHDKLAGAGFTDVNEAVREIVLGPVYRMFRELCIPAINQCADALSSGDPMENEGCAVLVRGFTDFVDACMDMVPSRENWASRPAALERDLTALHRVLQLAWKEEHDKSSGPRGRKAVGDWQSLLREGIHDREGMFRLLSFLVIYAMKEENEEWKLEARLEGIGDFRYHIGDLCNLLSGLSGWHDETVKASDILDALGFLEVQGFLKINFYDKIRWYNKERMDLLPWWFFMRESLDAARAKVPDVAKMKELAECAAIYSTAHEGADCKLDEFRKSVRKSAGDSGGKKPVPEKKPKSSGGRKD